MRNGVKSGGTVPVAAVCAVLVLATGGCGVLGSNKGEVCADAKRTVQEYIGRLKEIAANDPAQWKQTTDQYAGRFDALAKESDDKALSKALRDQSARLRAAAAQVGNGDVAALNQTLTETPARLGEACG
ncbi:hypothetical protein [Thermomonospora sp. CIF 1]|uniref:hypothetical protein n=1 Tax=Thermomonospora sp. CIF 1 TaxID=1916083 RepID=UPI00257BA140|nr:hypothetical protein [Thermomonospora sp. CIF 1]